MLYDFVHRIGKDDYIANEYFDNGEDDFGMEEEEEIEGRYDKQGDKL